MCDDLLALFRQEPVDQDRDIFVFVIRPVDGEKFHHDGITTILYVLRAGVHPIQRQHFNCLVANDAVHGGLAPAAGETGDWVDDAVGAAQFRPIGVFPSEIIIPDESLCVKKYRFLPPTLFFAHKPIDRTTGFSYTKHITLPRRFGERRNYDRYQNNRRPGPAR